MRHYELLAWKVPLVLLLLVLAWAVAVFVVIMAAMGGDDRQKEASRVLVDSWRAGEVWSDLWRAVGG